MGGCDDSRARIRSRLLPILVVTALIAASGCSAYVAPSNASADLPTRTEAADRFASLQTLEATVTTVQTRNNETVTTVVRKRHRLDPWAYRDRVLSVNQTEGARAPLVAEGGVVVVNASTLAFYDPASNRLHRATIRGSDRSEEPPYPRLVGAARSGRSVARPTVTPGVSSLPRVPVDGGSDSGENGSTSYREGNVTVAYTGTETVDGRQTYRLEVTPTSTAMSLRSQTLWLDAEYLYPIKRHTEFTAHGDRYEYTVTYRNVTFNPTLEPDIFRLGPDEVPEDARRVQSESFESAAAMAEAITFPVPEPTVPEGFEFESASYRSTDPEFATLRYERPNAEADITVSVFGTVSNDTSGTPVQIGPHEARRVRSNGTTAIEWVADGYTYRVSGEVDADTLVRVARSVADRGTARDFDRV